MKNVAGSPLSFKRQKGLAAVEFTIAIPFLLMLFIATAELGKLLYDYNTLTKSQRNGIRYLAAQASSGQAGNAIDNNTYISNAKNLVVYGTLDGSGTPLLPGFSTDNVSFNNPSDDEVRVFVSYAYSPMVFDALPTFGFGSSTDLTLTLTSSITMRALIGG